MDISHSVKPSTPKQMGKLRGLAHELGFDSLDLALSSVGMSQPLSIKDASAAIDQLLAKLPGGDTSEHGRMGAEELLAIDAGALPLPDGLDASEIEILRRLAKFREIERVMGTPAEWPGANRGGPILIEQLVTFFGSIELVAGAFGVGADTVRGWGSMLPEKRAYEAQVKTRGYVCAPKH